VATTSAPTATVATTLTVCSTEAPRWFQPCHGQLDGQPIVSVGGRRATHVSPWGPGTGAWLTRRVLDGALNRVPDSFHASIWKILEAAPHGLGIGSHVWPPLPTLAQMTANEFNFILACDAFLDHFQLPAERHVAIEALALLASGLPPVRCWGRGEGSL
jgi:hypothetical protein